MKKLTLSIFAATLCVASLHAKGQGYMALGYGTISTQGYDSNTVIVDFGARFGETIKQGIGMKYIFKLDEDISFDSSAIGDIYYQIGYEVLENFIVSAEIGYAFEDVGSVGSGSNSVDVYATGLSYGADFTYRWGNADFILEYKKLDLEYEIFSTTLTRSYDMLSGYIGFRF